MFFHDEEMETQEIMICKCSNNERLFVNLALSHDLQSN